MVIIDFESRSAADLPQVGATHYARDPSTDILMMGYKVADAAPQVWEPGEPFPTDLGNAIQAGETVWAHNAGFDRALWEAIGEPRYQFPPVKTWRDSKLLCALAALPRSLAGAAEALALDQQKQAEGRRLIKLFCQPRTRH